MDVIDTSTDDTTDELDLSVVGQLGRLTFSSIAGFMASKAADRVYDSAVRAYRARKSS